MGEDRWIREKDSFIYVKLYIQPRASRNEIVGLYNAAHPLASFASLPLMALLLIYVPVPVHCTGPPFSLLHRWLQVYGSLVS